jgi:hypothetical protein
MSLLSSISSFEFLDLSPLDSVFQFVSLLTLDKKRDIIRGVFLIGESVEDDEDDDGLSDKLVLLISLDISSRSCSLLS